MGQTAKNEKQLSSLNLAQDLRNIAQVDYIHFLF